MGINAKDVKDYYIGLDIGTNSVGWAVTDKEYNLLKFKKKSMWGIRLFDEANYAETRRANRSARRRLARAKQRIDLLQELFYPEISKVDPNFFRRLDESRLWLEDKSPDAHSIHPLFNDKDYTDKEYYDQYPTIFHLRYDLIKNKEAHDIRLVYLALHHIIKNRGHFLIDGNLSDAKDLNSIVNQLKEGLFNELGIDFEITSIDEFSAILKSKQLAPSEKAKQINTLITATNHLGVSDKTRKQQCENIVKFIVGLKGDLSKIFCEGIDWTDIEAKKISFKFSDASYEEQIKDELATILEGQFYVIDAMKSIYDWVILTNILGEHDILSEAKIASYDKHKDDLRNLKTLIKKYCKPELYYQIFKDKDLSKDNYESYKNLYNKPQAEEKKFFKLIEANLKELSLDGEDAKLRDKILQDISVNDFLPLQRSKSNSSIPMQIHKQELEAILNNASSYLPFLLSEDKDSKSIKDKIISIFEYRIPYYVGPLSTRHQSEGSNTWIERNGEGYIYPWNFDDLVDTKESNIKFIERMTNKCTYLPKEDVLPKHSLLYSKFLVLNELNNLKVNSINISVSTKMEIFNDLFILSNSKTITKKKLAEYLKTKNEFKEISTDSISGVDDNIKSSLRSYHDFYEILGDSIKLDSTRQMVEEIIRWITIYGNDHKMITEIVRDKYSEKLSEEQIKKISHLHYTGWGRLSEKLLTGIIGTCNETGEQGNIMYFLEGASSQDSNENLMQLLSKKYTFNDEISKFNHDNNQDTNKYSYDSLVSHLYTSPANKRAIWQSLLIVKEIVGIMKNQPKRIFIEMARGEDNKKEIKPERKKKLLELYKNCDKDLRNYASDLETRSNSELNSKKLYLYYLQQGKCMYTGNEIDLNNLLNGSSNYNIDHIIPQSIKKDNSFDNMVLVEEHTNQTKGERLVPVEYQQKMKPFWQALHSSRFISDKKYNSLTRTTQFTDDELAGFVARQLVETRQSTKLVADLLQQIYPETKLVYVSGRNVSEFRKDSLHVLKSRLLNDYHHAKDAYLNIVVGNVYSAKFTDDPYRWMKERHKAKEEKDKKFSLNAIFWFDVFRDKELVWKAPDRVDNGEGRNVLARDKDHALRTGTIDLVRKTVNQNDVLYTEYTYCDNGKLFDTTIQPKGKDLLPIKNTEPLKHTERYGGYKSIKNSFYSLIEIEENGKCSKKIIGIPIYIFNRINQYKFNSENSKNVITEYCNSLGYTNVKIIIPRVKQKTLFMFDGFPMRISGYTKSNDTLEFYPSLQLSLDKENSETIRLIEKFYEKKYKMDKNYIANEEFDSIDNNKLNKLYDTLVLKLKTSFSKRPYKRVDDFINLSEKFYDFTLTDKTIILYKMMDLFSCRKNKADLTGFISPEVGRIRPPQKIISQENCFIVNQSITGLFTNRIKI